MSPDDIILALTAFVTFIQVVVAGWKKFQEQIEPIKKKK